MDKFKTIARKFLWKRGLDLIPANVSEFRSDHYLRHDARRLEHLASLEIPVAGMTVLEVGAGIGDHSHYYIDRQCPITITEARRENLRYLMHRYPDHDVQFLDMETPYLLEGSPFDLVHCYGLLYHLSNPEQALEFLSTSCKKILFLETCVSFGDTNLLVREQQSSATQAYSGVGSRPARLWLFEKLRRLFDYVYLPRTQPNHEEFPTDWTAPKKHPVDLLSRAIFIASREKIDNARLTLSLIDHQTRHT